MNAKQFRQVIEMIVKEEVRKEVSNQLPKLLFEMLGQQPKVVVREQVETPPQIQKKNAVAKGEYTIPKPPTPQPKQIKRYVKNPVLNQILNETTPGLPQSSYDQGVPLPDFDRIGGVSEEFKDEMKQILNENSIQSNVVEVRPSESQSQEEGQVDLSKLFNKPFKAILEASKKGHSGGMSKVIQSW